MQLIFALLGVGALVALIALAVAFEDRDDDFFDSDCDE
jgi:hypothetical protein